MKEIESRVWSWCLPAILPRDHSYLPTLLTPVDMSNNDLEDIVLFTSDTIASSSTSYTRDEAVRRPTASYSRHGELSWETLYLPLPLIVVADLGAVATMPYTRRFVHRFVESLP